ncbi:hypothetical protein [Streptomyces atacamensis]|uniref:hypothetical protein n=1 Tax=Streptomyces atacamensis TaxID=531966 RepID=UPI00399CA731
MDQDSATVWLALKAPRKVTLDVYEGATGAVPAVPALTGTRVAARLGEHLYVVAVTVRTPSGGTLRPGTIHRYALRFGADVTSPATPVPVGAPGLFSPGIVAADEAKARSALLYQSTSGAPVLPSFATPPDHPAKLRLFHASCRKPHAGGQDRFGGRRAAGQPSPCPPRYGGGRLPRPDPAGERRRESSAPERGTASHRPAPDGGGLRGRVH